TGLAVVAGDMPSSSRSCAPSASRSMRHFALSGHGRQRFGVERAYPDARAVFRSGGGRFGKRSAAASCFRMAGLHAPEFGRPPWNSRRRSSPALIRQTPTGGGPAIVAWRLFRPCEHLFDAERLQRSGASHQRSFLFQREHVAILILV